MSTGEYVPVTHTDKNGYAVTTYMWRPKPRPMRVESVVFDEDFGKKAAQQLFVATVAMKMEVASREVKVSVDECD